MIIYLFIYLFIYLISIQFIQYVVDDCFTTMSDNYVKIVTMNQLTQTIFSIFFPAPVTRLFGFKIINIISWFTRKILCNIPKWTKFFYYNTFKVDK